MIIMIKDDKEHEKETRVPCKRLTRNLADSRRTSGSLVPSAGRRTQVTRRRLVVFRPIVGRDQCAPVMQQQLLLVMAQLVTLLLVLVLAVVLLLVECALVSLPVRAREESLIA